MIQPILKDDLFVADVRNAAAREDSFQTWWLGQSGFLLHWQGHYVLLDPYLSDSLTRKYAATDKPHVRMTERVVAPQRLGFVELITASHLHTDHLDAETILPVRQMNPDVRIVVPLAIRETAAERLGVEAQSLWGMDASQTLELGPFELHAVAAAHESLDVDDLGRHKYLGYIIKFGPWSLYHSGDTVCHPGLLEKVTPFRVDLALLPINGRRPERRVAGNMTGSEAAQLARDIEAKMVIPCHFEMFEFNTESPEEFVKTCRSIGQPHCVLRCGERWECRM